MLNHKNEANCTVNFNQDLGTLAIVAQKPIERGEEVYLCINENTPNHTLLFNYGFVTCDNGYCD